MHHHVYMYICLGAFPIYNHTQIILLTRTRQELEYGPIKEGVELAFQSWKKMMLLREG